MPTNVTHPLVVSGCSSAFLSEKYRRGGVSDMPAAEVLAQICATGAASPTRRATGRATAARTAWRDAMARMLCPRRAGKPSPPALSQRAARAGIASRPALLLRAAVRRAPRMLDGLVDCSCLGLPHSTPGC